MPLPLDLSGIDRRVADALRQIISTLDSQSKEKLTEPEILSLIRSEQASQFLGALQSFGLIDNFGRPIIGTTDAVDPDVTQLSTQQGTITSIVVNTGGNLSGGSGTPTTSGAFSETITDSANPTFTTISIGGGRFMGYTTTALAPSTTEYPNDKDFGFHFDSLAGKAYVVYNKAGTILKAELT